MIRKLTALIMAAGLTALTAGCGADAKPAPPANNKGTTGGPKGNGPVVIMPTEMPRVVIEAEAATDVQPHFKAVDDSEASGGKCLTVPSKGCNGTHHQHIAPKETDPERTKGSAELAFNVDQAGDYYLWIRRWWCCSCGDSFSLQLDDRPAFVFGNDGTTCQSWQWWRHQETAEPVKFKLSAGAHKLIFRNRGESGFRIDQVILAADPQFQPQGKQSAPAASAAPAAPGTPQAPAPGSKAPAGA